MIEDIKLGLKIYKYGLNKKSVLITMYAFMAIGAIFTIIVPISVMGSTNSSVSVGGMYMGIIGMFIPQLIITGTVSKMVQSSQYKYKLQVVIPSRISFVLSLIAFSFFCAINLVEEVIIGRHWQIGEEFYLDYLAHYITIQILLVGVFMMMMQVYNLIIYKMTPVGYIVSFLVIIPFITVLFFAGMKVSFLQEISRAAVIIIGYAAIIAGYLISRLLGKAMYRRELCSLTYKAALNKDFSR